MGATTAPVRPLGYWALVWRRLRRDRLAVASGGFLAFLLLAVAFGGPILSAILGHGPNDPFPYAVDQVTLNPVGPFTRVPDLNTFAGETPPPGTGTTLLVLGGDGPLSRDELLRLLDGGRVSLIVALGGTALALTIGLTVGIAGAWFGGLLDAAVARLTELVMAFPLLFFIIFVGSTWGDRVDGVTLGGLLEPGVLSLVLVIGCFTWFYPARVVRTEVLALREREFVDAALMIGASDRRILRSHLLPHLLPSLVVYATLLLATNILLEAGISFLGIGIELPTASWGSLLSTSWGSFRSAGVPAGGAGIDPWLTIFPSVTIFLTVLAFNLLGEGLRSAFDPLGNR